MSAKISGNNRKGTVPINAGAIPKSIGVIPKPTGAISKPTGVISKPTGVFRKSTVVAPKSPKKAVLKPTRVVPKFTGAVPKPTRVVPKSTGAVPKLNRLTTAAVAPTSGVAIPRYLRAAPRYPNLISPVVAPTYPNIVITQPTLQLPPSITTTTPAINTTIPAITTTVPAVAPTIPIITSTIPAIASTYPGTAGSPGKSTGAIPKSNIHKPTFTSVATTPLGFAPTLPSSSSISASANAVPQPIGSNVYQSNQTPIKERRSSMEFTKEALDVINECIKNGLEAVDTIRSQAIELGPLLRKALTKVNQGTQAAISFKDTISRVNTAIVTGNKDQVLREFEIIMQDVHEMTNENMLHLSEVIYSIYIRKLISSFLESDFELNKISINTNDAKTREITGLLIVRNQIIINALVYVSEMLPKRYNTERQNIYIDQTEKSKIIAPEITPEENTSLSTSRKAMNSSVMAKKLFILEQSLNIPEGAQVESTQMEIRLQSDTHKPPTPREDGKYRDRLSGFMRLENGDMEEVLLVLKEHIKQPEIASNEMPKMLAFIDNEMVDVDEVSYLPQKSKNNTLIALVEDNETKETHEVQMTLVPKSPNESANGNIIALIPYSSPTGFLDSSSEITLVSSSFESPGASNAPKSKKLLKKAQLLKSQLFPKSPRAKKVIDSPSFKSYKLPNQSPRPPLQTFDNWMSEMNENDVQPLGPDDYQDAILDVSQEEPPQIPKSQLLIEHGKILCMSMQNDLEILKVINAARFPKQTTPQKQYMSPNIDHLKEDEPSTTISHDEIQELINFLQPLVSLPIESALQTSASSPNKSSVLNTALSPNESSVLVTAASPDESSVLATKLDDITTCSAILREQVNISIDEMLNELQNSDHFIPEYQKALNIAKIKKETVKKDILESMQALSGKNEVMVALVENPQTGEREQVLVDLVPTDSSNTSNPGRIIGFIDDFENEPMPELAPRSMDYSFSDKLTPEKAKTLPFFVTPPRVEKFHKREKRMSSHHTASRAPKTTEFRFKKTIFDQNPIGNDPDLFEEELELVEEPKKSGYEKAVLIAQKMRDELQQILLAQSPPQAEEEPPNNSSPRESLRRQLFFDPSLPSTAVQQQQEFTKVPSAQQYIQNQAEQTGQHVAQLATFNEQQLLNNQTQQFNNSSNQSQHSSPIRSMLQSPIQSGHNTMDLFEQLVTLVNSSQELPDNQNQKLNNYQNPIFSTLERPIETVQIPINNFVNLLTEIDEKLEKIEDQTQQLHISLGSPDQSQSTSHIQTEQNQFDEFAQLVAIVAERDLISFNNSISSNQVEQHNILQDPLIPSQFTQHSSPPWQSPGVQFIKLLPQVVLAEDLISFNASLSSNQVEQQGLQDPLFSNNSVFVSLNQSIQNEMGQNLISTFQSPGQHLLELLPKVLVAEELLVNQSQPLYFSPDQTQSSIQNQSVLNTIQEGELLSDQIQPFL